MAHPVIWPRKLFYYPVGNTAPICMTQDIPPEKSANVLLLGCGDPRNILFTIHTSGLDDPKVSRTLSFTCCDHEPAILARNVLLFTLLADGVADIKGPVWSIFYDFYIDKTASTLLNTQSRKLLDLSKDTETWRTSQYGGYLKMGTAQTIEELRHFWKLWANFEGLPSIQKVKIRRYFSQGQAKHAAKYTSVTSSARSAGPLFMEALSIVPDEFNRFWKTGQTDPNAPASKSGTLNPTFAYSTSGEDFPPHYGTFPIGSFHLALGFVTLEGSGKGTKATPKALFTAAQAQLEDWGKAFRKSLGTRPKVVIKFNYGDALAFCRVLCQRIDPASEPSPVYSMPWKAAPLELDEKCYTSDDFSFDVIDTSNLADHLGPVNVLVSTRPLLTRSPSSVLYTETLLPLGSDPVKAFSEQICGDIDTTSLLLDLAPVAQSSKQTTHSNVHEIMMQEMSDKAKSSQFHQRMTWKIPSLLAPVIDDDDTISTSPMLEFDASRLGICLHEIYTKMFNKENANWVMNALKTAGKAESENLIRQATLLTYTRESLALLARVVKGAVSSREWLHTMEAFFDIVEADRQLFTGMNFYQDMVCMFHCYGLYTHDSLHPRHIAKGKPFVEWSRVPTCVWITLQVPRFKLRPLEDLPPDRIGSPIFHCEVRQPHTMLNAFANINIAFGSASRAGTDEWPIVTLNEDKSAWSGSSPLLVWFQAPAWLLTVDAETAFITLAIKSTVGTVELIPLLGMEMQVYSAGLFDAAGNVSVTPDPPVIGSTLSWSTSTKQPPPVFATSSRPMVQVKMDHASKLVTSFTRRLDVVNSKAIAIIEDPEMPVSLGSQRFPSSIALSIGTIKYWIDFPLPVDLARTKLRVVRESHYVEIIASPSTSKSPGGFFAQHFPIVKCATTLTPWNVHRVNLDRLPILKIVQDGQYDWLIPHLSLMMSERERRNTESKSKNAARDIHQGLGELKHSLQTMFISVIGLQGQVRQPVIGLSSGPGIGNWTLFFFTGVRMDLSGNTVILDGYVVPLTEELVPRLETPLRGIASNFVSIPTSEREVRLWKELLPAATERCRQTWAHRADCEYLKRGKCIPLSYDAQEIPICSCGAGKDVAGLTQKKEWAGFAKHATRVGISPLFAISHLETVLDFDRIKSVETSSDPREDRCGGCHTTGVKLLTCSRCKTAKYCSAECQRGDWKTHKNKCS